MSISKTYILLNAALFILCTIYAFLMLEAGNEKAYIIASVGAIWGLVSCIRERANPYRED